MVKQVSLVPQAHQVRKVQLVQVETQDLQDRQDRLESKVQLDQLVVQDRLDCLVLRVLQV